jgi:Domain of unknown function (DUF6458)
MGFGASLAFIALGAILAFAVRAELNGVDIQTVGWILILVGVIGMALTLMYARPRRTSQVADVVEEEPLYVVEAEEPAPHVHEPASHVHEPAPHVHEPVAEGEPVPPHVHTDRQGTVEPAEPPTQPAPQPGRHIEQGRRTPH